MTKYQQYIDRAQACSMRALAFSEHGSVFEWWHKKIAIEKAGMKYIHAAEAYITSGLREKVRDNYHCILIAKDLQGFYELNRMTSAAFNRNDGHFYYVPRISMDELFETSEHIIITTACIGGILGKGDQDCQQRMIDFCSSNSDRCFLEIGHHMDERQIEYNQKLFGISQLTGIRLIAGTDTHALNSVHEKGRHILQLAKKTHFDGEDKWDLKFHDYDELVEAYRLQGSLPEPVYLDAIENTNVMADMVEPFTLDQGSKYPHIYANPRETFREKIETALQNHPYALSNHRIEDIRARIDEEFAVYDATNSIDFMLLEAYMREWEAKNGIQCGYGRGSVSGSMIAYILGITQIDSMRFDQFGLGR